LSSTTALHLSLAACFTLAAALGLGPTATLANTPPVAEDDVYRTGVDEPLSVPAPGVLDNDSDANADPLEAVLVSDPDEGGTVDLRADGSFDYTPPAGYAGNDAFTYQPFDGTDFGNLAEVTVRIGAPPEPYTVYFDEVAYLSDLADLGHVTMAEGFEEDAAWGSARSPFTQPSVLSKGIAWTSNNDVSEVTTGSGPARTGVYGFFCLPHGNHATGIDCHIPGNCTDGWLVTGGGVLYGAGGWIEGNFGKIEFFVDGTLVGLGDNGFVNNQHQFFGVIHPAGFTTFEVHETEGTAEDQKIIFADDFTFGVPAAIGLSVHRGQLPEEVELTWWGGQPLFTVFRSDDPSTVTDPGNDIGSTSGRLWNDTPPVGDVFFYRVSGP
jgi:hypothetical protein